MTGSQIGGNFGSVQIGTSSGWKVLINTVCLWKSFQFNFRIWRWRCQADSESLLITEMLVACLDREIFIAGQVLFNHRSSRLTWTMSGAYSGGPERLLLMQSYVLIKELGDAIPDDWTKNCCCCVVPGSCSSERGRLKWVHRWVRGTFTGIKLSDSFFSMFRQS